MVEKNDTASISLSKGFLIIVASMIGGGAATGAILGGTSPSNIEVTAVAQQAATLSRLEESQRQQADKLGKVAEAVARIEGQLNSRK
jgi:hypothetical protein